MLRRAGDGVLGERAAGERDQLDDHARRVLEPRDPGPDRVLDMRQLRLVALPQRDVLDQLVDEHRMTAGVAGDRARRRPWPAPRCHWPAGTPAARRRRSTACRSGDRTRARATGSACSSSVIGTWPTWVSRSVAIEQERAARRAGAAARAAAGGCRRRSSADRRSRSRADGAREIRRSSSRSAANACARTTCGLALLGRRRGASRPRATWRSTGNTWASAATLGGSRSGELVAPGVAPRKPVSSSTMPSSALYGTDSRS